MLSQALTLLQPDDEIRMRAWVVGVLLLWLPAIPGSGGSFVGILHNSSVQYNRFHRPPPGNASVPIDVFIHFESLRDITSEVTLDFYFLQFWNDSRLLPERDKPLKITGRTLPDDLWYPDSYFLLVRDQHNSGEEQYIVVKDQQIEFNRKVRLKTPCTPNVMLFPFDVVNCDMVISSFGYTLQEVTYSWMDIVIDENNNNVDHIGFFIRGFRLTAANLTYDGMNYSSLSSVIYLERKYSAYLMQVYFPAALIVILSWTIFWINLQATPARASLGVTTVLTMLTLATQSTGQNSKHVNGKVTAIDIYLWICFLFVIFAMLEFALSDFTTHSRDQQSRPRHPSHDVTAAALSQPPRGGASRAGSLGHAPDDTATQLHQMTRCRIPQSPHHSPSRLGHLRNKLSKKTGEGRLVFGEQPLDVLSNPGVANGITHSLGGDPKLGMSSRSHSLLLYEARENEREKSLNLINNLARVAFPAAFLLFNVIYWATLAVLVTRFDVYRDIKDYQDLSKQYL